MARTTDETTSLTRHEEELHTGTAETTYGSITARKRVERDHVEQFVPLGTEYADAEHVRVDGPDSGEIETLADGSISIPLFEEELVVEKRLRVRERIVIRKHTRTEQHHVEAELRREEIEVEAHGDVLEEGADDPDVPLDGR